MRPIEPPSGSNVHTKTPTLFPILKINGGADGAVDLVITDPQGRRLGYDPTSGVFYNEIVNSYYFREGLAANINDEVGDFNNGRYGPIEFSIGEFIQGLYTVKVFGIDKGAWSINFGLLGNNFDFDPNAYTASGWAEKGSSSNLDFDLLRPRSLEN